MNKVLLFGGTGEGRALAEWMVARGIPHTVCVATEYGETLLPAGAEAHVGRMDSGEMEALMRAGGYSLAVDATHPYAVEVTEHIRAAAEAAGLPSSGWCGSPTAGSFAAGQRTWPGRRTCWSRCPVMCCSPPAARSSTTLPAPDWQSGAIPGCCPWRTPWSGA